MSDASSPSENAVKSETQPDNAVKSENNQPENAAKSESGPPDNAEKKENSPPSDIVGKKVFFVFPTAYVQNQIISELVQHEYEVYISKNPKRLAHALKKFTDSVVFVNIDEGMPESEWEKWIRTLMTSQPNVNVGVFSSNSDDKLREKYLDAVRIKCGYYNSKLDMSKTTPKILEALEALDVKGRRKYLRANTEDSATINLPASSGFLNGTVRDVSVVGISCTFSGDVQLHKNELVKDIQIRLQTMLLKAEAVVFGSRLDGHEKVFVLIFTQRVDPDVKVKIRKYIQQNLQHKIDKEIN